MIKGICINTRRDADIRDEKLFRNRRVRRSFVQGDDELRRQCDLGCARFAIWVDPISSHGGIVCKFEGRSSERRAVRSRQFKDKILWVELFLLR